MLCTLTRDQDTYYAMEDLGVLAYYRVLGGTPSRMICTLFIGSTSQQTAAVYTATAYGTMVSGGARGQLVAFGGPQSQEFNSSPVTVLCTIPAKTSFASITYVEMGTTNVP